MISMSILWQEVQNEIPHISFETTFSKVLPVCPNDVIKKILLLKAILMRSLRQ